MRRPKLSSDARDRSAPYNAGDRGNGGGGGGGHPLSRTGGGGAGGSRGGGGGSSLLDRLGPKAGARGSGAAAIGTKVRDKMTGRPTDGNA